MTLDELRQIAEAERQTAAKFQHHVCVCAAAGCLSSAAADIATALKKEIAEAGMQNEVKVKTVGCMGLCGDGPLVSVEGPDGTMFANVTPDDAPEIVRSLDTGSNGLTHCATGSPFFSRQKKIVLENSGIIDPERSRTTSRMTAIGRSSPRSLSARRTTWSRR